MIPVQAKREEHAALDPPLIRLASRTRLRPHSAVRAWPPAGRLLIRARRGAALAAGFAGRSRARSRRGGRWGPVGRRRDRQRTRARPGRTTTTTGTDPPPPSCSADATAPGQSKGKIVCGATLGGHPHQPPQLLVLWGTARGRGMVRRSGPRPGCRRRRRSKRLRCICIASI